MKLERSVKRSLHHRPLSRRFFSQHPVTFRYYLVSCPFNSVAAVQAPQNHQSSTQTHFQTFFQIQTIVTTTVLGKKNQNHDVEDYRSLQGVKTRRRNKNNNNINNNNNTLKKTKQKLPNPRCNLAISDLNTSFRPTNIDTNRGDLTEVWRYDVQERPRRVAL